MLYRQKKDTHISVYNGHGYITNTGLKKRSEVDVSGSVFLKALSDKPQTLEQLTDKLLETFTGADRAAILPDAQEFYDKFVEDGFLVKGETKEELDLNDSKTGWNLPVNEKTINFFLPGLNTVFQGFYIYFARYMQKHHEYFRENIRLSAFYGSFNNAIWQGGRSIIGMQPSPLDMEDTIHKINDSGVAVRYTYTNSLLEEKHLNDTLCNLTMELANNGQNEVLVNSPLLEKYLRKNYPDFKYILSTTRCERSIDKINEATEKYDLVVIDYRDNRNIDFLEKIKNKDKIEILVDDYCPAFCHFRKKHYETVSKVNLLQGNLNEGPCMETERPKGINGFYNSLEAYKATNLSADEVYGQYVDMGFKNFKLIGRDDSSLFAFESFIYYLVKPEFRDKVRDELIGYYVDYIIRYYGGNKTVRLDQPVKN